MRNILIVIMTIMVAACNKPMPVVSSGKIERLRDFKSSFVDPRNVDIWLPAGYNPSSGYAVIYMHDGQMLFDSTKTWNGQEWKVDEVVSELISSGKIKPCIVVGIWNNGDYRHTEYFPEKALDGLEEEDRSEVVRIFLKDKPLADEYLRFITEELKPYVDSHYSSLTGPENTIIMGSSMGGLISLYALCEYPGIFGRAGCLSTHWPMINPDSTSEATEIPVVVGMRKYLSENLPDPEGHRIWFDYGTATLDSFYEPHQLLVDEIMISRGYGTESWETRKFEGTDHSEKSWSERLDIPLVFLLGESVNPAE
ncbi:MAG: alpha/beta hydrolase [Actinomycetota bacterium]|jgi:enterochelin esterase-like enzyme